jgi:hypothetical protein
MDDNQVLTVRWLLLAVVLIVSALFKLDILTVFIGLMGGAAMPVTKTLTPVVEKVLK